MNFLKKAVRTVIHNFGYEIKRRYPVAPHESEMQRQRRRLLSHHGISVVLDVGGNRGAYGKEMRSAGYTERIVSFEPLSEAYTILCHAASEDAAWECHNMALGERNESAQINIAGNLDSSSFLDMDKRHLDAAPFTAYRGTESVTVKTLDSLREDVLAPGERVWMKLDVQGFELSVLRGAAATLTKVEVIETELSYVPLYKEQPLLCDMVNFLSNNGFDLVFTENTFADAATGHTLQVDALFVSRHAASSKDVSVSEAATESITVT